MPYCSGIRSALNSFIRRPAALAKAVQSFSSAHFAAANAQVVLATSCALNSLVPSFAALSKAVKRFSSHRFTDAKAHAVLARFYALNSIIRRSAAPAKAAHSKPSNFALPM